jgi:hypothetical protein
MCSKITEDLLNAASDKDADTESEKLSVEGNRTESQVFIKKIYRNTEKAEYEQGVQSVLYAVMNEQGKMLAVTDTRESAQFYCKNHNYDYSFSV